MKGKIMKRFLLFAWNSDEKSGGWNDFEDSFDTAEAAKKYYEEKWDGKFKISHDMYDIVDTHPGERGIVVNI
jgi:hypothetical protein